MTTFAFHATTRQSHLPYAQIDRGQTQKRACVFIGPSAWIGEEQIPIPADIDHFAPAPMGAIHQAVMAGYTHIGLVDGLFGLCPAVWHKEILFALASGVRVYGASSMGALRAAELSGLGMQPVGAIARLYARGAIVADDEVCLLHLDARDAFRPMSMPLVDQRFLLRKLRRWALLSASEEELIISRMKELHFTRRSLGGLRSAITSEIDDSAAILDAIDAAPISQKTRDARRLINVLADASMADAPPKLDWQFPMTAHWRRQFVVEEDDLPRLADLRVGGDRD